ncbi:hypothetical protein NVS89_00030 [Ancylobacter sp. MQZ15Z-1]|uniref:Uncharacterized protein n=1 Tax=Ancylobacter mangrovi TaxID=2972472 RepID=A0A9X2PF16_9HYPH|nr:hypothetical protein [Ancylobacter mangrovi]MCS0493468.1 hypothetical protein [Ancylobacter mangrovi]
MTATIVKGDGWLRTLGFGSSTASYEITVRRSGADEAASSADGVLTAEVGTMVEARHARRAVLVLEDGRSVGIDIGDLTASGLAFTIRADSHRSIDIFL